MSLELPGMIIELSGTSMRNKGAELMTAAICRRFHQKHPNVQFAVPQRFGTAKERYHYGLCYKLSSERYALNRNMQLIERMSIKFIEKLIPERLLRESGLVTNQQVEAVLDASGFAFGDQLPANRITDFIEGLKPLRRKKTPVVLLPQAFGPFSKPKHQEAMKRLLDLSDLIFARDDLSFQHLIHISGNDERIQQCPDLTLAVDAPKSTSHTPLPITVIPNSRMLDKIPDEDVTRYQDCLVKLIQHAQEKKIPIQILLHDRDEDIQFVDILSRRIDHNIETITDNDPIRLKSILASSALVISSRFHALAGALSSGVPAIAIGWSHKYDELMSDFNLSEYSLDTEKASKDIDAIMDTILTPERHSHITKSLKKHMTRIQDKVDTMWQRVDQTLQLA